MSKENPVDEQQRLLDKAKEVVVQQSFVMNRCLDNHNLMDALKHASNMICELRTSNLSPKSYYALYMDVYSNLLRLEAYLVSDKHGKRLAELYELVQYAGNILPRLYLLITVGSVYIKLKEAPAKDVLRDIVEMCRGVQHPTRGLFLRTYLSEVMKDRLPDTGSEYSGRGGSVKDSVDFILQNFTEMNKLWVRMQHQGPARERERREIEREELCVLVGKNVSRLSQLEGVDLELYQKAVLPRLLEQIVNCRDTIAQQYLMDIIIQVFPDDFHLRTLEPFLKAVSQLQGAKSTNMNNPVKIRDIVVNLIQRLENYVLNGDRIPDDIDVFQELKQQINEVIEQHENTSTEDLLALQAALLQLSIVCYPDRLDNVDQVFENCAAILAKRKEAGGDLSGPVIKQIVKLMAVPLDKFKDILIVLQLKNYPKLLDFLDFKSRKKVAVDIANCAIKNDKYLTQPEQIQTILTLLDSIIKDQDDQPEDLDDLDDEDLEEEQNLLASLVHLFANNDDVMQLFAMYGLARKAFGQGGQRRIKYTLVPLVLRVLQLAVRLMESGDEEWPNKAKKIFKFSHDTISALAKQDYSLIALHLFLQASLVANKCGSSFETIAYEFVTQALLLYEEHIPDSQTQFQIISLLAGSLHRMEVFGEENYDTLITKTTLYASKLLKKPDQCRAIYLCSHLFWRGGENEYKNGKKVLNCLQKSLKVADSCVDSAMNVHLFVEIFNEFLFFFGQDCPAITVSYLSGLVDLVNKKISKLDSAESEADAAAIQAHYKNTLEFIKLRKKDDDRYSDIPA